jgi:hypothetical protein
MKILFFLCIVLLNSCARLAQKEQTGLIIDPDFHHSYFQNYPYYFVEGEDSLFIDSVLVSTNITAGEMIFSALIQDSSNKHYAFDKCRSYFLNDTLVIEFVNSIIKDGDELKVKVLGSHLFASFYSGEKRTKSEGLTIFLKLKEAIKRKGQVLFGELKVDFSKQPENLNFVFQGPFTCVIGNN